MDRGKRVDALIKVNVGWDEEDREALVALEDAQFDKIEDNAVKINELREENGDLVKANKSKGDPTADISKGDDGSDGGEGEDEEDLDTAKLEKGKKQASGGRVNRKGGKVNKGNADDSEDFSSDDDDSSEEDAPKGKGKRNCKMNETIEVNEEQVLAALGPDVAETLASLKANAAAQRKTLVSELKRNARVDFSEDELNDMSLKQLEKIADLACIETDYSGGAGGVSHANSGRGLAPSMPKMEWAEPRR